MLRVVNERTCRGDFATDGEGLISRFASLISQKLPLEPIPPDSRCLSQKTFYTICCDIHRCPVIYNLALYILGDIEFA